MSPGVFGWERMGGQRCPMATKKAGVKRRPRAFLSRRLTLRRTSRTLPDCPSSRLPFVGTNVRIVLSCFPGQQQPANVITSAGCAELYWGVWVTQAEFSIGPALPPKCSGWTLTRTQKTSAAWRRSRKPHAQPRGVPTTLPGTLPLLGGGIVPFRRSAAPADGRMPPPTPVCRKHMLRASLCLPGV